MSVETFIDGLRLEPEVFFDQPPKILGIFFSSIYKKLRSHKSALLITSMTSTVTSKKRLSSKLDKKMKGNHSRPVSKFFEIFGNPTTAHRVCQWKHSLTGWHQSLKCSSINHLKFLENYSFQAYTKICAPAQVSTRTNALHNLHWSVPQGTGPIWWWHGLWNYKIYAHNHVICAGKLDGHSCSLLHKIQVAGFSTFKAGPGQGGGEPRRPRAWTEPGKPIRRSWRW